MLQICHVFTWSSASRSTHIWWHRRHQQWSFIKFLSKIHNLFSFLTTKKRFFSFKRINAKNEKKTYMRLGNEVLFRLRMKMRRFCLATTSKARLLSCALVRELTLDNYLISFPATRKPSRRYKIFSRELSQVIISSIAKWNRVTVRCSDVANSRRCCELF